MCRGVTRAGRRCQIQETSSMSDSHGKLVAEPLRRGCPFCRFHIRPFSHAPATVLGPMLLFFLDLETTGTDVSTCRIVELAVAQAHDLDHLPAASFAQVVSIPHDILHSPAARAAAEKTGARGAAPGRTAPASSRASSARTPTCQCRGKEVVVSWQGPQEIKTSSAYRH